jgi:predicted HTH transcriptional regulator
MFDGKRIQEIDILHVPSSRRNPVISDVFYRLKYMERRGSGIKKILKEYEDNDLPQFFSDQQYFIVTLLNKNFYNNSVKDSSVKSSDKILKIINENQSITLPEIAELVGISKRAVEKQIAKLKDEGVLKRVGGRKNGYWEVNKNS